jgi:CheY-like chemotaxis protein
VSTVTLSEKDVVDGVLSVLIVDDNRDTVLTLGVLLRSEGYLVYLAKNGAEALKLAQAYRPDAALLDLHMPGGSGFDVARELQRRYRTECPILIAVTAHTDMEHRGLAEISASITLSRNPTILTRCCD